MSSGSTNINISGGSSGDSLNIANLKVIGLGDVYHDAIKMTSGSTDFGTKLAPVELGNKYNVYEIHYRVEEISQYNYITKYYFNKIGIFDYTTDDPSTLTKSNLTGFSGYEIDFGSDDDYSDSTVNVSHDTIKKLGIGKYYTGYNSYSIVIKVNDKINYDCVHPNIMFFFSKI